MRLLSVLHAKLATLKYRLRLWWVARGRDAGYRAYLRAQLDRTLLKRSTGAASFSTFLIDALLGVRCQQRPDAAVLCVGCRTTREIDYFKANGLDNVIGIDLFSAEPEVRVMDMHHMTFRDNSFGIVYASHSLEHAYDEHKVASEIVRVARDGAVVAVEAPVQYETRGADRLDFGDSARLRELFEPYVRRVLWSDDQPAKSPTNDAGVAVARVILVIRKSCDAAEKERNGIR